MPYPYDYGYGESLDVYGSPMPFETPLPPQFSGGIGQAPPSPFDLPQSPFAPEPPGPPPGAQMPGYDPFNFNPREHMNQALIQAGAAMLGAGDDLSQGFSQAGSIFGSTMQQEEDRARKVHEQDYGRSIDRYKMEHGLEREALGDTRYDEEKSREITAQKRREGYEDEDRDIRKEEREGQAEADLDFMEKNASPDEFMDAWLQTPAQVADRRAQIEADQDRSEKFSDFTREQEIRKQYREEAEVDPVEASNSLTQSYQAQDSVVWNPPTELPPEVKAIRDPVRQKAAYDKWITEQRSAEEAKYGAMGFTGIEDAETGSVTFIPDIETSRSKSIRTQKQEQGLPLLSRDYSEQEMKELGPAFSDSPREVIAALLRTGMTEAEVHSMVQRLNQYGGRQKVR